MFFATTTVTPMDWSASIAWIAFFISLAGTIAGPFITSALNNRHQLKLRKLDIAQRAAETYDARRYETITVFLSQVGHCITHPDIAARKSCGESFHRVYQFAPSEMWADLDELYVYLNNSDVQRAALLFETIAHRLSEVLKEPPPLSL